MIEQKTIDLFAKIIRSVAPPKKLTVSEWADENRIVSSENAAEPGRWNTDRAPYQREIMNAINDTKVEKVVVMSAAQIGKSEIINNIIGYYIDVDPCPIMLIQPTIETAQDYSKRRIAPMIRDTKVLQEKVADIKARDINNTILLKTFYGGFLSLGGANSPASLCSKPVRIVLADEIDRYPDSAGTEGDPIKLAEKRTTTFPNRKHGYFSTPTVKGASRIEFEYELGSRESWCVECPHCGGLFPIKFSDIRFEKTEHYYKNRKIYNVTDVKWRCPACLEEFDEHTVKRQPKQWIADNPESTKIRSFHLNAFAASWIRWRDLVQEFLDCKDDPEKLKTFYNTVLGESWEDRGEIEDEDFLIKRQEDYPAEIPDGVIVLTAGVDTQDDRLEYEIVGWGHAGESWGIEKGFIVGKPDNQEVWTRLIDIFDKKRYFADGRHLIVTTACVDSGGHYTESVYKFCKMYEHRQVFAIKGKGGSGIPFTSVPTRNNKYKAALFTIGVDSGKAHIMSTLKVNEAGVNYCHFPKNNGYDRAYFEGLLSEKMILKKRNGRTNPVWEKVRTNIRNEALDCRNYATAAFRILNPNLDKIEKYIKGEPAGHIKRPAVPKRNVKKSKVW